MKTHHILIPQTSILGASAGAIAVLLGCVLAGTLAGTAVAQVQPFSSGSTGAYGAIDITVNTTLQVPEDGVFNATTINVDGLRNLTFTPNSRNTPIFMLATGAVTISGVISVRGESGNLERGGKGAPGGFDGGNPNGAAGPPSAGQGPGGGLPGTNASSDQAASAGGGNYGGYNGGGLSVNDGQVYGNALAIPLVGGSGGAGTTNGLGGGGGGGAILIASDVSITGSNGTVRAAGGAGAGNPNAGSGGAIRLVAPLVTGTLGLDVSGPGPGSINFSGHGRARVDTLDRSAVNGITHSPNVSAAFSVGSFMLVNPNPLPRLDIISAAGTAIPEDNGPVSVILPNGAPSSQIVRVQGRDFVGLIDIEVVVTPQNGTQTTVTAQIDMGTGNPATVDVPVEIPANTTAIIHAWRR
jgi:hypothetical protein